MVSDNLDNISHRAVIRYLGLVGLTSKEIDKDMVVTLGKNSPPYTMVKCDAELKRGRDNLEEDRCERRPVTVTTQETIAKIHDITTADRE